MTTSVSDLAQRNAQPAAAPRLPLSTRDRRPGLIALLVLLVVGCALAGALLVSRMAAKTEVLVAAKPVPAGHVISRDDLGTAMAAGSLRAIAANDVATVVGQTARVPLVEGQLLNRGMLTAQPVPAPGEAMIGLSLKPGQLPGDGFTAGDRVQVVVTGAGQDAAAATALAADPRVLAEAARVYAVRPDEATGGNTLVTLLVPAEVGARLAVYGAAGQLGLVKVASTP
jgi:Flp pilus assembly protein CpaB